MATSNVEKRRKLRALEAQRDVHMEAVKTSRSKLAQVRAALKHLRAN
jgi:hypothetical protein